MISNNSLLPKEAVALIQHIELNKAGWWDKSIRRLVLACVWLSNEPPDTVAIQTALKTIFKLSLSTQRLKSALETLESGQKLLRLAEDKYRIPEQHRVIFEREIAASEESEDKAKELFFKLVSDVGEGLKPEEVWEAFEQEFLGPLIKQVGANAYRLVAGEKMTVDKGLVDHFLKPFPSSAHDNLRTLVASFIDPKKEESCAYISRMLHARFCVEASGLPETVLKKLNASIGKQICFQMFVDTNFLFSLMELHENPSNAAAQELRELVDQLKGNPHIDFVITPKTIEEAKSSISYTKVQLNGLPSGRNFTQAALQGGFSGMAIRFLTERLKRNGKLTTDEWFDPYLNDFVPMARSKGVELFNERIDDYSTRKDVVDDIHVVFEFEKRLPENKRKSYPKVAHDMVLWHFVNDRRPAYIESPIDANCWILTVDFRLIGFDEHKQKHSSSKVPLCIHPTSLIQLLQFWVPRTKEFEEAMLGSLRLPFLFQDFDAEGEKTSLRILKGIGRFDGSDDLAEETITHVMFNEGLRSRMRTEHTEEAEIALIRDAMVEEIKNRAEEEENKAKFLEEEVRRRESDIAILVDQKRIVEAENAKTRRAKEDADRAAQAALDAQKLELGDVKARLHAMEQAEKIRSNEEAERREDAEKLRALLIYTTILLGVIAATAASAWWMVRWFPQLTILIGSGATRLLIGLVVFIFCHLFLELFVSRRKPMSELWPLKQVSRFRRWLWSLIILGFVLGVVGNLVANRIQENLDKQKADPKSSDSTQPVK